MCSNICYTGQTTALMSPTGSVFIVKKQVYFRVAVDRKGGGPVLLRVSLEDEQSTG